MKKILMIAALALALTACTDAEVSSWGAYGDEATVTCYSGGQEVFKDTSTGKVEGTGDGVQFRSQTTGRHVRTYADCIVISR